MLIICIYLLKNSLLRFSNDLTYELFKKILFVILVFFMILPCTLNKTIIGVVNNVFPTRKKKTKSTYLKYHRKYFMLKLFKKKYIQYCYSNTSQHWT